MRNIMRNQITASTFTVVSLLAAPAALGQTVTFELIQDTFSANDMSPEGRFIVGTAPGGVYLLDTETGVKTILPAPGIDGAAVSDDGQFVLGDIPDPEGVATEVAGLWSATTNQWQSLGYLPDSLACPSRSNGYELSADGSIAVGLSWDGCSGRGFMWTEETGMLELEPLANGGNRASVISADGSVIAGFAQGSFSRTPAMWDANTNGQLLDPPTGDVVGEVRGMSADGTILLGNWDEDAFRWTAEGGAEILGNGTVLPGWVGNAMDIAEDGTIVGFDHLFGQRLAWIQPQGTGPLIELGSYIESHGGTVPDGTFLEVCQAISRNGRVIIGHSFITGGWKVTIEPEACPEDTDGNGAVDVDDLTAIIIAWGTDDPAADVDGNGIVDVDDLTAIILAWGPC
jgi:uncharacterized membrane protein